MKQNSYIFDIVVALTILLGVKRKRGTASVNTDSQWCKREACFAGASQVWLGINQNTSATSGE